MLIQTAPTARTANLVLDRNVRTGVAGRIYPLGDFGHFFIVFTKSP